MRRLEDKAGLLRTVFISHATTVRPLHLRWTRRDLGAGDSDYDVDMETQLIRPRIPQIRAAELFWNHVRRHI